ncbi:MAG: tryptophan synthase subunit alpha, partial [Stenotrophomonas nitritireducens]|nr:tryptophan synthase subunit alpha [Stenotrophomonas nitritireducens]
ILLASPTSSQARLDGLCDAAQGYLYYVSFAGVTGASERLDSAAAGERLRLLRSRSTVPVVAGFGIKYASSAAAMAVDADGVVVGSALVAAMAEAGSAAEAVRAAGAFLAPLPQALDA